MRVPRYGICGDVPPTVRQLTDFLNLELQLDRFPADPSNNGLQLADDESREVCKVAFAVDGVLATFEAAAAAQAQMIVVHHGLSWGGEPRRWIGMTGRRMNTLFRNGIALYAAHLPLDVHAEYGNNAGLCKVLDLQQRELFFAYHGMEIGYLGELPEALSPEAVQARFGIAESRLFAAPAAASRLVRRVAVVSGGGGDDALECAIAAGADLLVTGEMEHVMYHRVQESHCSVLALGHYASETFGVKALSALIHRVFAVEVCFLDFPSGL